MEGGVLPLIAEMLRRIGIKKPKYFAVIDFTIPSADRRRIAEVYHICNKNRGISMNSHSNGTQMRAVVFSTRNSSHSLGLLGVSCELYLDDLIIYGESEEEFFKNLEDVMTALETKGITCNPAK